VLMIAGPEIRRCHALERGEDVLVARELFGLPASGADERWGRLVPLLCP
jgi:hypothetical protein